MRKSICILLTALFLFGGCVKQTNQAFREEQQFPAIISTVVDGDTIKITFLNGVPDGCKKNETVRLIGVNTPELNLYKDAPPEYFAEEAYQYTKRYYQNEILIELDKITGLRDKYGRLLAYVWLCNATMLNKNMIEDGIGRYYGVFAFDETYMNEFMLAETAARSSKRGMWENE